MRPVRRRSRHFPGWLWGDCQVYVKRVGKQKSVDRSREAGPNVNATPPANVRFPVSASVRSWLDTGVPG